MIRFYVRHDRAFQLLGGHSYNSRNIGLTLLLLILDSLTDTLSKFDLCGYHGIITNEQLACTCLCLRL